MNSNSEKILSSSSSSGLKTKRSSNFWLSSTSVFKETSSMFLSMSSKAFLRFSPTTPLIESAFSLMLFISPYSFNHFAAVFCPTFGTPGILSEASPTRANISLIWHGFTPNFSKTFSSLKILCFMVSIIVVCGSSTSCIKSLSSDDITHLYCAFFAIFEMVAITSSASTPSISINGNPIARQIDLTGTS